MSLQERAKETIIDLRKHGLSNGTTLGPHSGLCDAAADIIEALLQQLQTKNTTEVTAKWLPNGEFAMCSNCYDLFKARDVTVFNFCPECGAKMESDKE